LGYYSLKHDFPVLKVNKVFHRKDPIWHFTVVGRPPQEDSYFGHMIHEMVRDLIPKEFPGLKAMHAVDVAGVHPLLLAIGKERYMPFRERKPEEILTIANRILGSGQTSLAKYLFILAPDQSNDVDIYDIPSFFKYVLCRIRFEHDLHFITNTTVDTLDYSGDGWNSGSKLILACCGPPIRRLTSTLPEPFNLPSGFDHIRLLDEGILVIQCTAFKNYNEAINEMDSLINSLNTRNTTGIAWVVVCDDSGFTAANWSNFLWVTFTRSNPSHDVYGMESFTHYKHWGCKNTLIIDARIKPHHAPVLETDPKVTAKVDKLFSKGGSLYGLNKKSNPTY
jgi:4-hydroxy-3-polyprenylbenzoate decarboxylase